MSISNEKKRNIYMAYKKDPSIKRSKLAKEFSVSHKTITKTILDVQRMDIDQMVQQGVTFYREILSLEDNHRETIINELIQSTEYVKCKQESKEYQDFINDKMKEFYKQSKELREKMLHEIKFQMHKAGIDKVFFKAEQNLSNLTDFTASTILDRTFLGFDKIIHPSDYSKEDNMRALAKDMNDPYLYDKEDLVERFIDLHMKAIEKMIEEKRVEILEKASL